MEIEKEGLDSTSVADALSQVTGCSTSEIGMAGRKDRWAVTSQWFSFPAASGFELREIGIDRARILRTDRHTERLRTGQLKANRFTLVIRELESDEQGVVEGRASEIAVGGFANRFGLQRFGRRGDNALQGKEILLSDRLPKDRRAARFMVSALQSEVFNRTLQLRDEDIGLATLVTGDLALDHRAGALFWIDSGDAEQPRADRLELSPTGPLFGDKMRRPFADAARWEQQALLDCDVQESLFRSKRGLRLAGTRRALRAMAQDLSVDLDGTNAHVGVSLGPGCYASVLLEELCGPGLTEGRPGSPSEPGSPSMPGSASEE